MAEVLKGNAVVGQSGGPTAVINQSLAGVIEAARKARGIRKLLGARHGVRGMRAGEFVDLKRLSPALVERLAGTPGAALGSTRDKPDEAYCQAIFRVFEKNDVHYFFYIGGNDSADTARIVREIAEKKAYDLRVFHIPKTIDNDLRSNDHCPGYGSAARFVACAVMGDDRDNASLPGVKIDVIMGRHAGWLTAACALARTGPDDGPHLLYFPERRLSREQFCADVAGVYRRIGRCLVAMSEGVVDENGKLWGERILQSGESDAHGNVQLSGSGSLGDYFADLVKTQVAQMLGGKKLRIRADTFGYLQRSFAGFASPVDAREARAVGRKAVQLAMAGCASGSVAIVREKGARYRVRYDRVELSDVARETRPLPDEFIAPSGHDVTPAFLKYARPLAGRMPAIGRL